MKSIESDWIEFLTHHELNLLKKLIIADYKINNLSKITNHSYTYLKKELTVIREKITSGIENNSGFK